MKFIYFDLGNVLLTFSHQRAARQMAEVAEVSEEQVWQVVFESGLELEYEAGRIDGRELYERFCEATGSRPDYDALELAGSDIFSLNTPVVPIVGHLDAAGYRLGILSNTSASHWRFCRERFEVLAKCFGSAVLSFEEQSLKPDARIYEAAIERAGVPAGEVFFVDDRPENVEGARRAGIDAVQFTSAAELAEELRQRGVRTNY